MTLTLVAIGHNAADLAAEKFQPGVFGISECVQKAAGHRVLSSVHLMDRCRLVACQCVTVWEQGKSPSEAKQLLILAAEHEDTKPAGARKKPAKRGS